MRNAHAIDAARHPDRGSAAGAVQTDAIFGGDLHRQCCRPPRHARRHFAPRHAERRGGAGVKRDAPPRIGAIANPHPQLIAAQHRPARHRAAPGHHPAARLPAPGRGRHRRGEGRRHHLRDRAEHPVARVRRIDRLFGAEMHQPQHRQIDPPARTGLQRHPARTATRDMAARDRPGRRNRWHPVRSQQRRRNHRIGSAGDRDRKRRLDRLGQARPVGPQHRHAQPRPAPRDDSQKPQRTPAPVQHARRPGGSSGKRCAVLSQCGLRPFSVGQ